MGTLEVVGADHTIRELAEELERLAQQPRLAQGDYEAQATSALCRAMALLLRSIGSEAEPPPR